MRHDIDHMHFPRLIFNLWLFMMVTDCIMPSIVSSNQIFFKPEISVTEEYNDNIFLTKSDKENDFITTIAPKIGIDFSDKKIETDISYSPMYISYNRFSDKNTWRHLARFFQSMKFSKNSELNIFDSFLRTEDPLPDQWILADDRDLIEEDYTVRKNREPYYINKAGFNFTKEFGPNDKWVIGFHNRILENNDPEVEDSKKYNPFFNTDYWISPQFGFETKVDYTRGEFDRSDNFDNWAGSFRFINMFDRHIGTFLQYNHTIRDFRGDDEDYDIYHPSAGIRYQFEEDSDVNLGFGYFVQDYENEKNEEGFVISGAIHKNWNLMRGAFYLYGASGIEQSNFGAENLGFERFYQVKGSFNYGIAKNIYMDCFLSFRRDEYLNTDPDRDDETISATSSIVFNPIKWLFIRFGYSHNTVDSSESIRGYNENKIFTTLSLSPHTPFLLKE